MTGQPFSYAFDAFRVDLRGARLLRGDEDLRLEPKVFGLLVYLIRHRDRLVEKRELLEALWEERFVSENALSQATARLRRALGDDAQKPRYIETVHTLGYRFVAEVLELEEPASRGPRAPAGRRRAKAMAAAAAVVAAAAIGLLFAVDLLPIRDRPGPPAGLPPIRSLAVLPLANLTGDPEQEYFVDGMQEALITHLSQVPTLRVISRHSTRRFKEARMPLPAVARDLAVDALVEGSVMRQDDQVRISVQLIRGANDEHLWAATYDRDLVEVLTLLSEVARAVSAQIELALTPEQEERLAAARAVSPESHEAYLRARHFLAHFTPEGAEKALEQFQKSAEIDPTFAPAWAGAGYARLMTGLFGAPQEGALRRAGESAAKALALDETLAEAHAVMGMVHLGRRHWPAAGTELRRAVELNPNDAAVRHAYADYLTVMGRAEEGLAHIERGLRSDPLSPLAHIPMIYHQQLLRRHDGAIAAARRMLELFPDSATARRMLARALWDRGDRDGALAELREMWQAQPELVEALERGSVRARARGALVEIADRLADEWESSRMDPLMIAGYYARAGETAPAIAWLERAFEQGRPQLLFLDVDPAWDSLRGEPRFEDLVRRIGLPR